MKNKKCFFPTSLTTCSIPRTTGESFLLFDLFPTWISPQGRGLGALRSGSQNTSWSRDESCHSLESELDFVFSPFPFTLFHFSIFLSLFIPFHSHFQVSTPYHYKYDSTCQHYCTKTNGSSMLALTEGANTCGLNKFKKERRI